MAPRSRVTVGALVVAATAGHAFYPAVVALGSRGRRPALPADPDPWPDVTVLVPAYNEANCIEAKVRDVLANGYPGAVEVLVVADGDPDTAARAERAGATVVTAEERLGKSQAINLGFSKVSTPVVVLSDANNTFVPGAIAALVRYFTDPRVGAVAGAKVEADGGGEDLYWRFESWLKSREWAMGTTIGLVGEIAAVRTDAFEPIPA
ncbi:MAG TPA: glycosyltransferase, partial [Acidimicrobiales bacterium]|nr:glycosyltransferase [Acidimicrobiales bacterium]